MTDEPRTFTIGGIEVTAIPDHVLILKKDGQTIETTAENILSIVLRTKEPEIREYDFLPRE